MVFKTNRADEVVASDELPIGGRVYFSPSKLEKNCTPKAFKEACSWPWLDGGGPAILEGQATRKSRTYKPESTEWFHSPIW
ncbi:unnamed protein product [Clonostachys rosea f. rosea IK726]|uniref:Uncharacterized protein n=1 Tax=Clonostachys rosea f. rosea IK726 TaxID=1349383 RepID=A0ACA9UNT3_BIOOC|nr:unnamed protein product [Clonostachys rosea f. rosea IK726]